MIAPPESPSKIAQVLWQDDLARHHFVAGAFFCLANFLVLAFFWTKLPPQIPLFYSHPWGEEQLATPAFLFLLPGLSLLVLILNLFLGILFAEEKIILKFLTVSSFIIAFLGLFGQLRILELSF